MIPTAGSASPSPLAALPRPPLQPPPPFPPLQNAQKVSDKERRAELDNLFKDVAQVLAEKTVNPDTARPYPHTVLERALRDLHFNPDPKKSAKQQALEVGRCPPPPFCGLRAPFCDLSVW